MQIDTPVTTKHHVSDPCLSFDEWQRVVNVLESGQITMGAAVKKFEATFGKLLGSEHAVSSSNGTSALHLALLAIGVKPGDEVIVPDLTFIATANAVSYCGATPVFVDVDETWGADVESVRRAVTEKTVGIIAVHLYGAPCKIWDLMALANDHKLWLVEDAAEGLGGSLDNRALGTFGHAGVFSFYGNKVLTTAEGGMLVTDDPGLAAKARLYRGQGQGDVRYQHQVIGYNYRMSDLHAAVGIGQLEHLPASLARRREVIQAYQSRLQGCLSGPSVPEGLLAPWLYTGVLPAGVERSSFMDELASQGIETRPTFVPLHDQPCYRRHDGGVFPNSTRIGSRGVSLPTHPNLSDFDVEEIADSVLATVQKLGGF